jgi:ADP-heptose:LPS heptosyltransferase
VAWRALVTAARLRPPDSPIARALLADLRAPVLALSLGAGAPAKRWRRESFAAVADGWRAAGGDVVEIAGPAEHDLPPLGGVRQARDWRLPDVAALLAGASAWVGNDSGPSHLAGVVGLPGRVLFGPTEPHRWRPLSFRLRPVRARPARRGTARVDSLSPKRVRAALQTLTTPTPGSSVRGRRAPRDGAASAPE